MGERSYPKSRRIMDSREGHGETAPTKPLGCTLRRRASVRRDRREGTIAEPMIVSPRAPASSMPRLNRYLNRPIRRVQCRAV